MSNTQTPQGRKTYPSSWPRYAEPAIRLIVGALVLLISIGFLFLPSLNQFWVGLSVLLFTGLAGSGIVQILIAAWESRFGEDQGKSPIPGEPSEIKDSLMEMLAYSHEAMHDKLTGLPNRTLLEDRMAHEKARAGRSGTGFAVFFICLDKFQQISTHLGPNISDKVLVAAARTLTGSLRPTDTVARWRDDEFVVLIPDLLTMDAAKNVAEKLHNSARRKFSGATAEIISFSVGVAVYPNDADSVSNLLEKADEALLLAKSLGRSNVQYASEPSGPLIWRD